MPGADLRSANLLHAYLEGSDLRGAKVEGANFSGASLSLAHVEGTDFSEAIDRSINKIASACFNSETRPLPDKKPRKECDAAEGSR